MGLEAEQELARYGMLAGGGYGERQLMSLPAGASFLLGSILGGVAGGAISYFAADQFVDTKLLFLPMGKRAVKVGPVKNHNIPHAVLNRARYLYAALFMRTHAERGALDLSGIDASDLRVLSSEQRNALEAAFREMRKSQDTAHLRSALAGLIVRILKEDEASISR